MTPRDYFAAHAPEEIPAWFECKMAEYPEYPKPEDYFGGSEEGLRAARQWMRDDAGTDLGSWMTFADAERAKRFQAEVQKVSKAREQVGLENKVHRYFAWRWFYADMMLQTGQA